jgi:hypothetical protein
MPLLTHRVANAPLAASRTVGVDFCRGLWDPRGVLVP